MARENIIELVGKITGNPTASYLEDYGTYKVGWRMQVYRRNQRVDTPHIVLYGLDENTAKSVYNDLAKKRESFVMVRGMISTRLENEQIKCPGCGHEQSISILHTEIIAFAPPVFLEGNYEADTLKEFANNANIIGIVCSKPYSRSSTNGTSMTQFQIVIHRKFRVKEQPEQKDDYPWVKTFASLAEDTAVHLTTGTQIYINGALQTRDVQRHAVCENCESQLTYAETVAEIVPYDVEYLSNWLLDENDIKKKEAEQAENNPPEMS